MTLVSRPVTVHDFHGNTMLIRVVMVYHSLMKILVGNFIT